MRNPTFTALLSGALTLALPSGVSAQAASDRGVPVHVGGDRLLDACGTQGRVTGLDPAGDNFLSLRSGPGGKPFRELARLHGGQIVTICEERGMWLGIVYAPGGAGADCGVSVPIERARAYRRPCRSGWVHKRYVEVVAG